MLAAALLAHSCLNSPPYEPKLAEALVFIPKPEVDSGAGSQFIYVTASGEWTLSVAERWASLDRDEGSGDAKGITLRWEANPSEEARTCVVTLTSGGHISSALISQEGSAPEASRPTSLNPDPVAEWLELPALDKGLCFFTHGMKSSGHPVRNYSFALDPDAKESVWVAYPLNRDLIGSGSRTDAWGLDPKVPEDFQPVVFSGFQGSASGKWYQRGHQIPSADRYLAGANEQTFYGTNITPQIGDFNEKVWATLEGMVRSWSCQFDTLYVVTGTDLRGSTDVAYDNYHKAIKVPTGYYKALLGYKKSGTIAGTSSTGGYTGVAFYFEHRDYGSGASAAMGQSMTIDELEGRLGMDFFPNLPDVVGSSLAGKVESTLDPWWSQNK